LKNEILGQKITIVTNSGVKKPARKGNKAQVKD